MCARYTLTKKEKELLEAYKVKLPAPFEPNYNLAPTQEGLVITADQPDIAQKMHFGLVPYWADSTRLDFDTLHARSETAATSKVYGPLLRHNKTCLILADGFYEFDRKSGKPLPYRFVLNDRELFAFPGLWSEWKDKVTQEVYRSFAIMTCAANQTVAAVHEPSRMAVIHQKHIEKLWIDKSISTQERLELCTPYPDDLMRSYRVSSAVNATVKNKRLNNHPDLILPMTGPEPGHTLTLPF